MVQWRDAIFLNGSTMKPWRGGPYGCSRNVTGFERCSSRVECDIELARDARGSLLFNRRESLRQCLEVLG